MNWFIDGIDFCEHGDNQLGNVMQISNSVQTSKMKCVPGILIGFIHDVILCKLDLFKFDMNLLIIFHYDYKWIMILMIFV